MTEACEQNIPFAIARQTSQQPLENEVESLLVVVERRQHVLSKHSCRFDKRHIVEQVESLQRRIGS